MKDKEPQAKKIVDALLQPATDTTLFEANLARFVSAMDKHDAAMVTAFRGVAEFCEVDQNCEDGHAFTRDENEARNRELKATLLRLGYGVTSIDGSYLENYKQPNQRERKEDAFFVVNLKDDPDFVKTIIWLGKHYCQDSVMIKPRGGAAYLYGTNHGKYPGFDKIDMKPNFHPAKEHEFMSRIRTRPFHFESIMDYNLGGKQSIHKVSDPVFLVIRPRL